MEKVAGNVGLIREAGKEMRLFSHEVRSTSTRGDVNARKQRGGGAGAWGRGPGFLPPLPLPARAPSKHFARSAAAS